jgi:GNAT superfamily N-acetyltransferase
LLEIQISADFQLQGKPWSEVNNLKKFLKNVFYDPFYFFEVDIVMFAAGLYVNGNYRNRGIAVEMLKARCELGKAVNVSVSSNVFSSLAAQKAAVKAGYIESFCIKYADLPKFTSDGYFPHIKDEYMKIMSKKFY